MMVRGFLSARIDGSNRFHHFYRNNGYVWWCHYTLHFGNRKGRIRKSLGTSNLQVAIARRDALFARIAAEGEEVPERRPRRKQADHHRHVPGVPFLPGKDVGGVGREARRRNVTEVVAAA